MIRRRLYGLPCIILLMALAFVAFLMGACRTERVAVVPEYHEVYIRQRDTISTVDSTYVLDSVLVVHLHDTIYITRTRTEFRDRWRDRLLVDTVIERDTVAVVRTVEKPPNRWQKVSMWVGRAAMVLFLIFAAGCSFLFRFVILRRFRQ